MEERIRRNLRYNQRLDCIWTTFPVGTYWLANNVRWLTITLRIDEIVIDVSHDGNAGLWYNYSTEW